MKPQISFHFHEDFIDGFNFFLFRGIHDDDGGANDAKQAP